MADDRPHLPQPVPIEAFGNGGFRFAGMSHRGSLLCRPDGIWASNIGAVDDLTAPGFAEIIAGLPAVDMFLIGSGLASWLLPSTLRAQFQARGISVDAMTTAAAVRTYNVVVSENRRVGALLIAVP